MLEEELQRYHRHIILPEIGLSGQHMLKKAKVLVVGAGGLGCPLLQYIAAAGIGVIGIADGDVVDPSNLHRQILYSAEDIGKNKAETAKHKLQKINPFIEIVAHTSHLTADNALNILKEYEIIADGTDNFATRYLLNDACVILNKPLVSGAIFKFEGQVSVFNYDGGPTYRCLFPDPPYADEVPGCSEVGVIGVLPGIVGTLQAMEIIKIAAKLGNVLSGKVLLIDALKMSFRTIAFNLVPENKNIKELKTYEEFCSSDKNLIEEITAEELQSKIENKEDIQLIDVREAHEYSRFNIGGKLKPLSTLKENFSDISKDKPAVIYCQSGVRSKAAIRFLQEKGYKYLFNLKGGINEWKRKI
ncbi:MAG: molybdopterin-synthase adenylyltransferase MoeB [Cytophagaceae bacterium]|nr:molybdopterin-synthase adenylyltransferase MoeB [Cytophagaceae bacterium]MDW8456891.1 molybdopterin-synthase adenylyltransferase MoeB [Cytophagaceae bacterium]